jgi:hypothetical protein
VVAGNNRIAQGADQSLFSGSSNVSSYKCGSGPHNGHMDKVPKIGRFRVDVVGANEEHPAHAPLSFADVSDLIPCERLFHLRPDCRDASVLCEILMLVAFGLPMEWMKQVGSRIPCELALNSFLMGPYRCWNRIRKAEVLSTNWWCS